MCCKKEQFNICRLTQESYKSPTFDFGETDISNDNFIYRVKQSVRTNGATSMQWVEYPTTKIGNKVVINEFELPIGIYSHEFLRVTDVSTVLLLVGKLIITDKPTEKCTPCNVNIRVNDCNEVINISYSENIIEINNSTLIYFEINENMELEQYESEPNIYDFELENGNLTLNFN